MRKNKWLFFILVLIFAILLMAGIGLMGRHGNTDATNGTQADTNNSTTHETLESTGTESTAPSSDPKPGTIATEPPHSHHYEKSVIDPTCTDAGYTIHTCACGDCYITDEQAALGHSYETQTVPPTTQSEGYDEHICSRCGDNYRDHFTEKLPEHEHFYSATVLEPTCTEGGYTTYTCTCGDTYTAEEREAKGHDYASADTAPTCTEEGYTAYTCNACGHSYTGNKTKPLGHDYKTETVPPTIDTQGYDLHTCTRCADSYRDNYTAPDYSLSFDTNKLHLKEGNPYYLPYTYTGHNTLKVTSDNPNITVKLDVYNKVIRITDTNVGTAIITLTDGVKSVQCEVKVSAKEIPDGLYVIVTSQTIFVGETYQIEYSYDGDKQNLTWTSRNPESVAVDSEGKVTALTAGGALIMVSDGTTTKRCRIIVEEKPDIWASDMKFWSQNGPLYDGITKYMGDHLKFTVYNYPEGSMTDIMVTSSNTNVVSVSPAAYCTISIGRAFVLDFKSVGTATITLTSGDRAVTKSFTITVKAGYDFDPGAGLLSPEEYAAYCTKVMVANGFAHDTTLGSWRQFTLTADQLTFARAVRYGQGTVHEWWPNGDRYCNIVYVGTNEDGKYVFHECWG